MYADRKHMYKVPWSTTDNQGGWIEVTDQCDLKCPGCYRKSIENHRPLKIIKKEIIDCHIKYLKICLKAPQYFLRKVYVQSLVLQQPAEFINGERNSCEPCINPMMFKNQIINPCQLDEYRVFGGVLTSIKV